jgi:hypothetical protein
MSAIQTNLKPSCQSLNGLIASDDRPRLAVREYLDALDELNPRDNAESSNAEMAPPPKSISLTDPCHAATQDRLEYVT